MMVCRGIDVYIYSKHYRKYKQMSSSSHTAYIKKLVKIVYEKERQIQTMKKALKDKQDQYNVQNLQPDIHPAIKKELENASGQLKEVSLQMVSMEEKMLELQALLEDQIRKNQHLSERLQHVQQQTSENEGISVKQMEELKRNQEKIVQLTQQRDMYQEREQSLSEVNQNLRNTIATLKDKQEKQKIATIRLETELNELKVEIRRKANEIKTKDNELCFKTEQIELLQTKLVFREEQVSRINGQNQKLKQNFVKLTTQYNDLKSEQETLKNDFSIKESQYTLINQTLKDYEEFAFEIGQYIEAAYVKHCCSGMLKSSKKLIRQAENCTTRFESAFCKLSQLQQWMDNTAQKLEKIIQEYELPNETLGNLSNIANSFEEKLELCDLTQRIEKEKMQMDKNEEQLLENLQKEVQKSDLRERSKLVELDEVREILKVTKEVNRELMDQINGKEYVLSECRKMYSQLFGNKSNPEFSKLKTLLNLKN